MVEEIIWKQEGNKIYFNYNNTEIYWIMPEDYKLENTHIDLLHLAEILLLSPFEGYKHLTEKYKNTFSRKFGEKNSLSFSTGVDSTAAMLLLPNDTILSYHYRDYPSRIDHSNAMRFIKYLKSNNRDVLVIPSNHEKIRTFNGLHEGFSTDFACLVHLVLLADYLNLKSISTGMVLESAYLKFGNCYQNFNKTEYYLKFKELFEKCGLYLNYPTAGLSEIITNNIVNNSEYKDLAYSCLRAFNGCKECYKCYRKQLLNGNILPMNRETDIFISKRPPKMAVSIIYACQKSNLFLPQLEEYMDMDLNFLERYYNPYLSLNNPETSITLINRLNKYGIKPMSLDEENKLREINII